MQTAIVKLTWHARPQRHDGDGRDLLLDERDAAKVRGHVANQGGQHADRDYRHEERGPAAELVCRGLAWVSRK